MYIIIASTTSSCRSQTLDEWQSCAPTAGVSATCPWAATGELLIPPFLSLSSPPPHSQPHPYYWPSKPHPHLSVPPWVPIAPNFVLVHLNVHFFSVSHSCCMKMSGHRWDSILVDLCWDLWTRIGPPLGSLEKTVAVKWHERVEFLKLSARYVVLLVPWDHRDRRQVDNMMMQLKGLFQCMVVDLVQLPWYY